MGCVYRPAGRSVWMVKYRSRGKWQYESSHSSRKGDAQRLLAMREGDVVRGVPITSAINKLTFTDAMKDVVNYHAARGRETKKLQARIDHHLAPFFGQMKMVDITGADAEAYRVQRKAAVATINRELGLVKQAFSLAIRHGKLLSKPSISLPAERNARSGFLEREQFESVR